MWWQKRADRREDEREDNRWTPSSWGHGRKGAPNRGGRNNLKGEEVQLFPETNTAGDTGELQVRQVSIWLPLKDDAVKVLHSICQQIWKTQQWPQDWKRSVFIPIPKKGNAKECSNYRTIVLISHTSKVMLKILQARLHQYVNHELPDVQAGFRKGRGTRDQIANICWIIEKARVSVKHLLLLYWQCQNPWLCGSQ